MSQSRKPKQIDLEYYRWLISRIHVGPKKEFRGLFELMHNTEFTWFVPNDDNRVEDGRHLRQDFFRFIHRGPYKEKDLSLEWVSVLEVIVALSQRLAFQTGDEAPHWAWRLIKNLGLHRAADPMSEGRIVSVKTILDDLIWRNYESNGRGGFFPLKNTIKDQIKVEIWYQMQEYVMELEGMG